MGPVRGSAIISNGVVELGVHERAGLGAADTWLRVRRLDGQRGRRFWGAAQG
jgi:hypothetical protein